MAATCAGLAFWFLIVGFIYYRNYGWAMALGGVAVSAGFIFGGIRRPQERKIERPDSPPSPSDLPDYDFKDAKPKDFK